MDNQTQPGQNIFTTLGLNNLPEEKKAELLNKMTDLVETRVMTRIVDEMNEDQKKGFDKLVESNAKPEEINQFLQDNFPNFLNIFEEETNRVRSEMLSMGEAK
ncbi:hypothetical protein GYA54_04235 [Candidatus Kuenenbacteria bacterium]|nr:hypothetical protein [Candidatus Kuenenbacteria bacterium]